MVSVPLTKCLFLQFQIVSFGRLCSADASGQIDIAAFGLSASLVAEIPHASVKVQSSGTVLFTGYGG